MAEIEVTANLHHPNLLPLFDSGEVGGLLFYATPFMGRERLTGDPPHKGSTVQVVIAKVITEQPGRIRAEATPVLVGDSVPRQVMRTPVGASHESQAA